MNTSLLESEVKSLFESYNDLFSTLLSMDTSSLDTPMSPGKWSAGQTAAHVILASELSVQYCLKGLQKGKNRQRAGILTGIRGSCLLKHCGQIANTRPPNRLQRYLTEPILPR
jgi:hypothetical protein